MFHGFSLLTNAFLRGARERGNLRESITTSARGKNWLFLSFSLFFLETRGASLVAAVHDHSPDLRLLRDGYPTLRSSVL